MAYAPLRDGGDEAVAGPDRTRVRTDGARDLVRVDAIIACCDRKARSKVDAKGLREVGEPDRRDEADREGSEGVDGGQSVLGGASFDGDVELEDREEDQKGQDHRDDAVGRGAGAVALGVGEVLRTEVLPQHGGVSMHAAARSGGPSCLLHSRMLTIFFGLQRAVLEGCISKEVQDGEENRREGEGGTQGKLLSSSSAALPIELLLPHIERATNIRLDAPASHTQRAHGSVCRARLL